MFSILFALSSLSLIFAADENVVTCGSVVKLQHKDTGHHLHSHPIAWGSGSGQQSVTAHGSNNEQGGNWLINGPFRKGHCDAGTPIKCGQPVSLEHAQTGKNIHSHLFKASLTGNQEVSAFGEAGKGDTGDDWTVDCSGEYWIRGKPVTFKHLDTGKFLYTSSAAQFNQQNCGVQCPIMGQTEVSAATRKDSKTNWVTTQGVYFTAKSDNNDQDDEEDL